ncbi:MAG: hypothetical protein IJ201_00195 [Solobacterium sp.]|nr:hypothetical protein [Solobacterium sp.]
MVSFATIDDLELLWRKMKDDDEEHRAEALLAQVSSILRKEADKVGKDLNSMVASDEDYASVVKSVTVDVVARILRQSTEGESLSQESQSGLGYSWSGTYAIPGGGIANAIMRNDLKRLGLRRQRVGVIELYGGVLDEN